MSPSDHSPVACPKNPLVFIAWELVKCIWKTCPPVSKSIPIDKGFLKGEVLDLFKCQP